MEVTPAKSNVPGMVGADGKEGRTLTRKKPSVAGPRSARVSVHKETETNDDWSSLATADPAFWLKGVDH